MARPRDSPSPSCLTKLEALKDYGTAAGKNAYMSTTKLCASGRCAVHGMTTTSHFSKEPALAFFCLLFHAEHLAIEA